MVFLEALEFSWKGFFLEDGAEWENWIWNEWNVSLHAVLLKEAYNRYEGKLV